MIFYKKINLKKIFLLLAFFILTNNTNAYQEKIHNLYYKNFYKKLEIKIPEKKSRLIYLQKLKISLIKLKEKQKSFSNASILGDIIYLNDINIGTLKKEVFKDENNNILLPDYVKKVKDFGYRYIELNSNKEYINNGTYKLKFSKFELLTTENFQNFENSNRGFLVKFNNGSYGIIKEFSIEKKISYEELSTFFIQSTNIDFPYVLENGTYYGYKYNTYNFLDIDGVYLSELNLKNIDFKKTLLIKTKDKYQISNNYQVIKLVSEKLIKDIPNKNMFLDSIMDDNRFYVKDYEKDILEIKNTTENLVKNTQNQDEKIFLIYKYIIENINYYYDFKDGNKSYFSGILTFKNKAGVCDGYSKLFYYMTSFAQINDVEIKTGFSFDSSYFPVYGHAWIRIGEYYYDPTYDDTLENKEFAYYKLPKDLIYYNRFDGKIIPENIKNLDLKARKQLAIKNLYFLYDNYSDYKLLDKIRYKIFLGIPYNEELNFKNIFDSKKTYLLKNNSFIDDYGYNYNIEKFDFYEVNKDNIENILKNNNLNFNDIYFFKHYKDNGELKFLIGYNLVFK